jgi:hypothetical protein
MLIPTSLQRHSNLLATLGAIILAVLVIAAVKGGGHPVGVELGSEETR